jgi:hypothetical protein
MSTPPGRSSNRPLPNAANPNRRPVCGYGAGSHVKGNKIRLKEVFDADTQRRRESQRGVHPWQVATCFHGTDRLSAHPGSGGQLGLREPGGLT